MLAGEQSALVFVSLFNSTNWIWVSSLTPASRQKRNFSVGGGGGGQPDGRGTVISRVQLLGKEGVFGGGGGGVWQW